MSDGEELQDSAPTKVSIGPINLQEANCYHWLIEQSWERLSSDEWVVMLYSEIAVEKMCPKLFCRESLALDQKTD